MEEYDYRGYIITYNPEGYYSVDFGDKIYEFTSYDNAADWVDMMLEEERPIQKKTYHIFYATKDRGYDEFIQAYTSREAEAKLRKMYNDILYITGINLVED